MVTVTAASRVSVKFIAKPVRLHSLHEAPFIVCHQFVHVLGVQEPCMMCM